MNCRVKSYLDLPKREREIIDKLVADEVQKGIDKELANVQKIWIMLSCIAIRQAFGFGCSRILQYVGMWKRLYKINARFKNKEEQTAYIRGELDKVFKKCEFPYKWVDDLENVA